MRVYVASKFERKAEVNQVQAALEADGHVITLDWTKFSALGLKNAELQEYLTHSATADCDGVKNCDAIVLLHDDACAGGFAELGIALGLKKLIAVVGGRCTAKWPIFYHHPRVHHFDDVAKVREWLTWCETSFIGRDA